MGRIENQSITLGAAAFTAALCIVFGSNAVAIKVGMSGIGVFASAGLRFAIASVCILIWVAGTGRPLRIGKDQMLHLTILSLLFVVQLSLFYLGLSRTDASRGTLVVNFMPFFVLLLAHRFIPGDGITLKKFLGLLLGFTGVAVVFLEPTALSTGVRSGDWIVLAAAVLWSCNTVYVKRIISGFDPFQIVLYPMIFSVPIFFIEASIWDDAFFFRMDWKIIFAMAYQSLVTASFGFVAWNTLLQKYGATTLNSFIFIMPIAGVLFGGLILGEPITSKIWLALFLIVSGILVVHVRPKRHLPLFLFGNRL